MIDDRSLPAIAAAIQARSKDRASPAGRRRGRLDRAGVVVMALDRRPEVLQQNGLFHGGVIAYLIDNATTAAAGTVIDRTRAACITAEYKINLVAPSSGDRLTCRAEVVKPGRSLTVVDARSFCRVDARKSSWRWPWPRSPIWIANRVTQHD
jgi:uncharacterized protein (TIGR00369 family)